MVNKKATLPLKRKGSFQFRRGWPLFGHEPGARPDAIDMVVVVFDHEAEAQLLLGKVAVSTEQTVDFGTTEASAVFMLFILHEAPEGIAHGKFLVWERIIFGFSK